MALHTERQSIMVDHIIMLEKISNYEQKQTQKQVYADSLLWPFQLVCQTAQGNP